MSFSGVKFILFCFVFVFLLPLFKPRPIQAAALCSIVLRYSFIVGMSPNTSLTSRINAMATQHKRHNLFYLVTTGWVFTNNVVMVLLFPFDFFFTMCTLSG